MKIFKKISKLISVIFLILTIVPLYLELGEHRNAVSMIFIGIAGVLFSIFNFYKDVVEGYMIRKA